jgi:hypothetical protein
MTEWVSQSQAVRLLEALGDKISQPALSQFLKGHPEVERKDQGPGRGMLIDFDALKGARSTRISRGPASVPGGELPLAPPVAVSAPPPAEGRAPDPEREASVLLSRRKAVADTETAEFNSRRARILAQEAEGRLLDKAVAMQAFMAAGAALVRALEDGRRKAVDSVRAAKSSREADLAMRAHEHAVRAAFAEALKDLAGEVQPEASAA